MRAPRRAIVAVTPLELITERVQARCGEIKRRGGWFRCAHPCSPEGDKRQSFAFIEQFDGTVLIASHKPSYSTDDCLRALGLTWAELFPGRDKRDLGRWKQGDRADRITHGYEYVDDNGAPIGRVSRTENKIAFPQGHYASDGEYRNGLNGRPLPLYLAPLVRQWGAEGRTIYVVEGEKDARAMVRHGYAATTKPGGGGSPWLSEHVEPLRRCEVVIVADRDEAGEKAARAAAKALRGVASSLAVVQAKEGKDAFDHLLAGHSAAEFEPRPDLLNASALRLTTFTGEFELEEVRFLWEPYLPKGKVVILDADGGTGKTSWFLALAAGLSIGVLPMGGACEPARTVLFFRDSDNPAEYETVYRANGGRPGYISYSRESGRPLDQAYAEEMIETIKAGGFSLFGLDPFYHFLPPGVNPNDGVAVLPFCDLVNQIAERTGATGIAVRHVGKGKLGMSPASELGLGTAMFRNTLRGQLVMRWHPEERGVVVVTDEKGSILVPRGEPFQFQRRGLVIEYLVDREDNPFETKVGPGRPSTLRQACHEWLTAFLNHGTRARQECIDAGIAAGYSKRLIDQAGAALGVVSVRRGKQAMWSLDPFEEDEP